MDHFKTLKMGYSIEELARELSLSKSFLRKEVRGGWLKGRRLGRRLVILREDLEEYLKGRPPF